MFEVNYPSTHGYDGKTHKINIVKAYEIEYNHEKEILIFGMEGNKSTLFVIKYLESEETYVFVPHTSMELVNLTSPYIERKDITKKILHDLYGKKLMTIGEKYENNAKKQPNVKIDKIGNMSSNGSKGHSKNDDKIEIENIYYSKAVKLIIDFLDENTNYQDLKRKKEVLELLNNYVKALVSIHVIAYLDDDLIDLGLIIESIKSKNVDQMSDEEFKNWLNNGYKIIDVLTNRIKKESK